MSPMFRLVVVAMLTTPAVLSAQAVLDTIQIRTQPLAGGVYVLFGSGGNIGLSVGEDAVFVVDDQFAPLTPKILAAIAALTPKPVKFVVNTHWHFDHSGGNENMAKAGALLVAHDNVRRRMSTRQFVEFLKREELPSPAGALPVVTFNDVLTFHLNGGELTAIHLAAAHPDGDAAIYFRGPNVLHMGDVYVRYRFPFIDLSSGGSLSGMITAVDKMLGIINDSTKVIPGHGKVANRADLRAYRDVLTTIDERVRKQAAAGVSLDRIIASKPTQEFDATWAGFIKADDFVRFAYAGVPHR